MSMGIISKSILLSWVAFSMSVSESDGWVRQSSHEGVEVFARERKGSNVKELRSIGIIDAPPPVVFRVVTDYESYVGTMPYTEISKVLTKKDDGKSVLLYVQLNPPLASRRDYTVQIFDESDWKGGKGFFKTRWTLAGGGPAKKEGVVRLTFNDGSWLFEPIENGTKTRATYYLFTDPGGALPAWLANKANSVAIPGVFEALRKQSKQPKYVQLP
jgi:hypothetical protein